MNKRIKELVEQVGYILESDQSKTGMPVDDEFVKKFAELIVKECVNQMENSFAGGTGTENKKEVWAKSADAFSAWNHAIKCSRDQIKQHFGIEK